MMPLMALECNSERISMSIRSWIHVFSQNVLRFIGGFLLLFLCFLFSCIKECLSSSFNFGNDKTGFYARHHSFCLELYKLQFSLFQYIQVTVSIPLSSGHLIKYHCLLRKACILFLHVIQRYSFGFILPLLIFTSPLRAPQCVSLLIVCNI